jgi:hypothetical protein
VAVKLVEDLRQCACGKIVMSEDFYLRRKGFVQFSFYYDRQLT